MSETFDLVVLGGGIVGLTAARALAARHPEWSTAVLEKESEVAHHQTGHNSGVVHSGVYYRPGSLKARLCLEGRTALLAFAHERSVLVRTVGKLIVAVRPGELPMLDTLFGRARANGVESVRRLDAEELADRLPGVAGCGALDVPTAAIVSYSALAHRLSAELVAHGTAVTTDWRLERAERGPDGWTLSGPAGRVRARHVVNCAGLQSDLVTRAMGVRPPVQIVGFRGDFYELAPRVRSRVPCLVYPVPDPEVPFLGVHLTPTVDGRLLAGPNATRSLAREGYRPGAWDLRELARLALFPGSLGLARRYGGLSAREWLRSWSPAVYLDAVRALWPEVRRSDLGRRTSGVRAQAVRPDGSLEDDFVLVRGPGSLHVLNAPSPAATAAFAIAERVADEVDAARAPTG